MLILTRKVGESIVINDDIKVTILGVKGMQVRIGIDAPKDVQVHREEIFKRIQAGSPAPDVCGSVQKPGMAVRKQRTHARERLSRRNGLIMTFLAVTGATGRVIADLRHEEVVLLGFRTVRRHARNDDDVALCP